MILGKKYTMWRIAVRSLAVLALLIGSVLLILLYRMGVFHDEQVLRHFVGQHPLWGPLIFIGLQTVQVIFPIIPGGLSTVFGFMIFGPFEGLLTNYIGICLGSSLLFLLVRRFGKPFILLFTKEATFDKYQAKIDQGQTYQTIFILSMLSPVSPADLLVMMTALTKMSIQRFLLIILICKPVSILGHSLLWFYGARLFHIF